MLAVNEIICRRQKTRTTLCNRIMVYNYGNVDKKLQLSIIKSRENHIFQIALRTYIVNYRVTSLIKVYYILGWVDFGISH